MTDFQVGDRVSVEGVVRKIGSLSIECHIPGTSDRFYATPANLTLVERPKRKLRVGSVWERINRYRYVAVGLDQLVLVPTVVSLTPPTPEHRSALGFDTDPQYWREVPVEELEAEAQG